MKPTARIPRCSYSWFRRETPPRPRSSAPDRRQDERRGMRKLSTNELNARTGADGDCGALREYRTGLRRRPRRPQHRGEPRHGRDLEKRPPTCRPKPLGALLDRPAGQRSCPQRGRQARSHRFLLGVPHDGALLAPQGPDSDGNKVSRPERFPRRSGRDDALAVGLFIEGRGVNLAREGRARQDGRRSRRPGATRPWRQLLARSLRRRVSAARAARAAVSGRRHRRGQACLHEAGAIERRLLLGSEARLGPAAIVTAVSTFISRMGASVREQ